ncbi:MAG TPA: GNAT family N-acetyltransferase [Chryseolinea sp.]
MEYDIRLCEQNDLPTLISLCEKHAAHERASYSPDGKLEALRRAILAKPPSLYCYVVESAECIVGYFTFTFDFSTWDAQRFLYLDCLYLNPEYRNLGIGKKVFELLVDIAIQNQCVNMQWQTPIFNESAIAFYKRVGAKAKEKMRFSLELMRAENCVG